MKEINPVPYNLYEPLLAKVRGMEDPSSPGIGYLQLSDEAKIAENGKYAWMEGLKVYFAPAVKDGVVDIRILDLSVTYNEDGSKTFDPKVLALHGEPPVWDILLHLITYSHPFIDFTGVRFDADSEDRVSQICKSPDAWTEIVTKDQEYSPVFSNDGWPGYISKTQSTYVLKESVLRQLESEVTGRPSNLLDLLDPHGELIVREGLPAEVYEKFARNEFQPTFKSENSTLSKAQPHMIDLPEKAYNQYITSRGNHALVDHVYGYQMGFVALPDTFKCTKEMADKVLATIPIKRENIKINLIRKGWLVGTGAFDRADYSLSKRPQFKDGKRTGYDFYTLLRLTNYNDLLKGLDPYILVKGALKDKVMDQYKEYTAVTDTYSVVIMYNGPAWVISLTIDGVEIPPIFFAEESVFYNICIKPFPELEATYRPGKQFIYLQNGRWCERNYAGAQKKGEGEDYHYPGINDRSVAEWIIGPCAHRLAYDKKALKSIEVYHPVGIDDANKVINEYAKYMETIKEEHKIDPEILKLITGQVK